MTLKTYPFERSQKIRHTKGQQGKAGFKGKKVGKSPPNRYYSKWDVDFVTVKDQQAGGDFRLHFSPSETTVYHKQLALSRHSDRSGVKSTKIK